jgi:hypothetical protein
MVQHVERYSRIDGTVDGTAEHLGWYSTSAVDGTADNDTMCVPYAAAATSVK